jgi:hypothetical protein
MVVINKFYNWQDVQTPTLANGCGSLKEIIENFKPQTVLGITTLYRETLSYEDGRFLKKKKMEAMNKVKEKDFELSLSKKKRE